MRTQPSIGGPFLMLTRMHDSLACQKEWDAFQGLVARKVPYLETATFADLAQAIAGCSLFLGNQSAALAIAHGLTRPVKVETSCEYPNCVFKRPHAEYLGVDDAFVQEHGY
jgi:hypothetical protein